MDVFSEWLLLTPVDCNFQSPSWSGFEKIKDEIINELELIERETDGQLSRIVGGLKA